MPLEAGLAAFKLGSAIGGIFKKKKKAPTPRDNMMSQARGARDAAEKYGFNPLTMLQYGQPGGALGGGGGPPPLASIDLLTGALADINDITSGDAARRRAADQLEIDLAQVKIDQAKNQMALDHSRAAEMASSPLGRRAVTVPNGGAVHTKPRPSLATADDPNEGHMFRDDLGDVVMPDPTMDRSPGFFGMGGFRVVPAPGWSSGEAIEENYGDSEIISTLYGGAKVVADIGYNVSRAGETFGFPQLFPRDDRGHGALHQWRNKSGNWDPEKRRPKSKPKRPPVAEFGTDAQERMRAKAEAERRAKKARKAK